MSAALTALSGAAGVELSGSYDLSSLMDILKAANPSLTQSTDDALPGQYSALLKGDFGARLDQENEMLYLRMSLFSSLFSILGKPYPKDVWISQSLEGYLDLSPDVTPTAVSYTHLDVYKRQGPDRCRRDPGPVARPDLPRLGPVPGKPSGTVGLSGRLRDLL